MLDATTKRKIDSARQILVGKVPDPKAQVEQITTALVYKFMDDMDKESQELGGQTRFFANGFEKYSWTKLLDKRLSGAERLDLYVQAITNMSKNPHIPQLFKDIFKGAALPYNDAQTLNLFLKEIDGFTFDHSEDLGDAYEYLLNVVGTSGEAGQFRTPRHIIDFIVEVVAPKKNETILDPACGTAGFLISAYKHILRQHDGKNDQTGEPTSAEKRLSPEEKQKMMSNFVGYDIDPGMMRIAIVNMYLHHFPNPKIYEYDTLTYEDRWDDTFDVILANPPFMTPKGGIRPHKRFSVQATRSEVLFVDYILEHLNIKGRAGIIVPEGVIFRNDSAYKELRKKLVEDGLYAVVSLPQGVFAKPGGKGNVKTSILFFDNQLAKKSNELLFVKIENDGFDLGAQRRKIDKNDSPEALAVLDAWKNGKKYLPAEASAKAGESNLALWVKKEKIAENGGYSLTSERYKEIVARKNEKWPIVALGEICEMYQPKTITSKDIKESGPYKVFGANGVIGYYDKYNHEDAEVLVTCRGATCGTINFSEPKSWITGNAMVVKPKDECLNKKFLYYILKQGDFRQTITGSAQPQITRASLFPYTIPLPPLEIQKEIVEQIEVKQNAIKHAKEIIKNLERERRYFGQSLRKLKDVEWVELGEVCEINPKKSQIAKLPAKTEVSFVPMADISENSMQFEAKQIKNLSDVSGSYTYFADNDVLLAKVTPCFENGKAGIARNLKNGIGFGSSEFIVLRASERILPEIVYGFTSSDDFRESGKARMSGTGGLQRVSPDFVKKYKIPLPTLEVQKQLVAEAEKEEEIIAANRRLIELMERKITQVLAEI
ncbi:MAG: N-6 DNA methylase [Patescibacteria group bacterium]